MKACHYQTAAFPAPVQSAAWAVHRRGVPPRPPSTRLNYCPPPRAVPQNLRASRDGYPARRNSLEHHGRHHPNAEVQPASTRAPPLPLITARCPLASLVPHARNANPRRFSPRQARLPAGGVISWWLCPPGYPHEPVRGPPAPEGVARTHTANRAGPGRSPRVAS
jgi:hypothetical protein